MKILRRFGPSAIVLALIVGALATAPATSAGSAPKTFIVDLKDGVDATRHAAGIARQYGGRTGQIFDAVVGGFAFKGTDAAARRLARDRRVNAVEGDLIYRAADGPGDARHLKKADVPEAHAAGYRGEGVTIALLDTGVRRGHEVFRAHDNIQRGKSCVGGRTNDGEGHGTASASQAVGKIGVAHEAKLIPVKVFPHGSLQTTLERLICGLNWVRKHNANNPGHIDIVNISIAGPGSRSLKRAVARVLDAGIVITAAAGNNGGATQFPAAYRGVLAATALAGGRTMASFSASGGDLTAIGVNVLSAENDGKRAYSHRSGTSRAAPQVAGAAAIVLSENPSLNVRAALRNSGKCPDRSINVDGGFCSGRWRGDDRRAEPLINAYCAGVFADPVFTDVARCGF